MRTLYLSAAALLLVAPFAAAQPRPADGDSVVTRLMAFDKNKDGKLTREEITDERLWRLFVRADADQDGVVTKDELAAVAREMAAGGGAGGPGGGFPGGGPGGGGPGGFRPPRPGEVLPSFLGEFLELTPDQRKQLDALQKEADATLEKILNERQKKQLKEMQERGPGEFRPPEEEAAAPATPPVKLKDVPPTAANVRKAVEKSLPVLMKGAKGHGESRSCFTCHNHGVPMLAFATARQRGFDVPDKDYQELIDFTMTFLEANRDRFLKGFGPGPPPAGGETDTTGYAFLALDAVGKEPDQFTAAMVEYTLSKDRNRDFWWTPVGIRPPTEGSTFTTTANAVIGLKRYGPPEHKEKIDRRIKAALGWLNKTPARDTEDRVFRLIGLKAAGATDEEVRKAAKELVESQRKDGGWAQLDRLNSDAYATGSALVALHQFGGLPVDDEVYKRGVAFLLGTQLDDGTWHVRTRSRPVQRYFESGFPHGKDQFISIAASGWATTALALTYPPKK